ncbi:hypothetical protein [Flavobacterium mekongense]|uniref:hypothetical protein n=1 Tax=Flavobacterium mekongense TaxID=3379707 RepID=UPI003999A694
MELNIDKVRPFSAIILFKIVCCLLSGFLFLFIFKRELFNNLDIFRLCVLSMSITAPILILNIFMVGNNFGPKRSEVTEEIFHQSQGASAFMGALLSLAVIYIPILLGYFLKLKLQSGIIWALSIQVFIILTFVVPKKKQ